MSLRQLKISDLQLNACGVWTNPQGIKILPVPHTLPFYTSIAASTGPVVYELSTPPEFEFLVRALGYTGLTAGTLIQIQWPDGRYLQNVPVDFFSFCGTGKRGRWLEIPKLCPPSSKIRLNVDNSQVESKSDIELYFEGVLKVPMVNG